MDEKLDLRGLLCPEPVIATKKALDKRETESVEALVDDDICVANLERLARSLQASCVVQPQEGFFMVTISKPGCQPAENSGLTLTEKLRGKERSKSTSSGDSHSGEMQPVLKLVEQLAPEEQLELRRQLDAKTSRPNNKQVGSVVFITREQLGDGDPEFSKTLANVFLQTLYEAEHRPRAILMANSGVKLMSANSATKKVLDDFRTAGCDVLVCGLCVEFYGLKQDINKDQITNMFAICEYLSAAEKVLQL